MREPRSFTTLEKIFGLGSAGLSYYTFFNKEGEQIATKVNELSDNLQKNEEAIKALTEAQINNTETKEQAAKTGSQVKEYCDTIQKATETFEKAPSGSQIREQSVEEIRKSVEGIRETMDKFIGSVKSKFTDIDFTSIMDNITNFYNYINNLDIMHLFLFINILSAGMIAVSTLDIILALFGNSIIKSLNLDQKYT